MIKVFIETNSYSDYFRGDRRITKEIVNSDEAIISVITLGELFLGFKAGSKEIKNIEILEDFLSEPQVKIAKISQYTSKIYGDIKYQLRIKGRMIPDNDIWIAASVIETDSLLVTYDRHFLEIPRLKFWKGLKK